LGHERTNRSRPKSTFVRFGPKADKRARGWIVRYVPITAFAASRIRRQFDIKVGNVIAFNMPRVAPLCVPKTSCGDGSGFRTLNFLFNPFNPAWN
jgi:hypothetical protein